MKLFQRNEEVAQPRRKHGCLYRLCVFMLIYLLISVILGALVGDKWLATQETKLENETVYRLKMEGTIIEQAAEPNPLDMLMNGLTGKVTNQMVGLDELISNIRLAKTDDRIKGIALYGGSFDMGMASAKALRDELIAFKTSGKSLIAYAEHYGELNYYVASVADRIYINPMGSLDWHGLAAIKLYYPRLMDKLGIKMNILKVGTFKSAVEPYFCTKMSDADKMQTLRFLNGAWSVMCNAVGESRGLTVQQLNNYADETTDWLSPDDYIAKGLVDEKAYSYDIDSILRDLTGLEDYHVLSTQQMSSVKRPNNKAENQIAVLYAEGEITDEEGDGIVGTKMLKDIKKIAKNKDIKAVVLRVNSPGGSANASEQIWHALQTLRQEGKPVVVSMGDYAASGGYYISCGADYIYAEPTTLTGSIGIFGLIPDASKLRDKIGIDIDGVGTNRHSDSHMLLKGMNDEEKHMMQAMVEQGYELFISRCAEGRHLQKDTIKAIAEGRVWLGTDAVAKGLVDSLGNIDDAINKAAELANIEHYTMAYYPKKVDFVEELLKELDNTSEEDKIIMQMKNRFSKPRIMALMPEISIR